VYYWVRIFLFYAIFNFLKRIKNYDSLQSKKALIGFIGDGFYNLNCMEVYKKLKQNSSLKTFWVSPDKTFLQKLRKQNIYAYSLFDFTKIPLYLQTNVWVTEERYPVMKLFSKKLVNLWHGIPFKGFDHLTDFQNFVNSGSMFAVTSQYFYDYFKDRCQIQKTILKITGYPRTDPLIKRNFSADEIKTTLNLPSNTTIVLFAPTWNQDFKGVRSLFPWLPNNENLIQNTKQFLEELTDFLKSNNITLLIRPHIYWLKTFKQLLKPFLNQMGIYVLTHRDWSDINSLLFISDILITDWSSIVHDFMLLDRPIIFLEYPYEIFKFYAFKERAGYIISTKQDFFAVLTEILNGTDHYQQKRQELLKILYDHLDGRATERVISEIMKLL